MTRSLPSKDGPVIIGDRLVIGARALILRGVTIGDNTVITAGAMVTRDAPSDEVKQARST